MTRGLALLVLLLLTVPILPVASAQGDPPLDTSNLLRLEVEFPNGPELFIDNYGQRGNLLMRIHDESSDAAGDGAGQPHRVRVAVEAVTDDTGWQYDLLGSSFTTIRGESQDVTLSVLPTGNAVESDLRLRINVTMETVLCCGSVSHESVVLIRTPGSEFAFLRPLSEVSPTVRPDQILEAELNVVNPGLLDRSYALKVVSNDCNLFISDANIVVPAGESRLVTVTMLAPSGKLLYVQEPCNVSLQMVDQQSGRTSNTATYNIKVQGPYVDPGWIINLVIVLAVIGGIIWLILLAKRRAEEEVLGKPQPPWTLPAEQVYLLELEKKDPQAAYVVRHFLMEDEYRSSLLWYHAYKKATRGRRAVERKVLRMERKFAKWDLKQQDRLDDVGGDHDKKIAKLQAKLDKKVRKAHKKERKKWRKQVGKLETKAANDHNKAMNDWRKEAKKARKKGLPEPKEPKAPSVDLPPEPKEERILLDDHPWAAKKEKLLDKADAAQEKAEARYEKQRAKRLAAMQRKMAKMADKIDDPAFVEEHPLLKEALSA